jgi:predicted Holliday junction resolvase-like endonuclease
MDKLKRYLTLSNGITVAIIIAVIVLVFMIVKTLEQNYQSEIYIKQSELENNIQEIENENMKLRQEYYKSAEYLELAARMANKSLPGESLVILPETYDEQVNEGVASLPVDDKSNPEKWLEFLFGSHK